MKKRLTGRILLMTAAAAVSAGSIAFAKSGDISESEALEYLGRELEEPSGHLLERGEDVDDIYSELNWISVADTFPEKYDLRSRGTVTDVKDQNPWGTCWSFATIAASETSILNSLHMTADSYAEQYGEDMDLSEKHLAWFNTKALPELSEYPEGEYPYEESQAGEGLHFLEGSTMEPLNAGGNYCLSITALAKGIGILKEKAAPYENSEGNQEKSGDWSLPEESRYEVSFELKNANILPSPSTWDEDGNYVYRPEATEAIKSELLSGKAVGISFYADMSMPEQSAEEKRELFRKNLEDITTVTEEEKAYYIDVRAGFIDTKDLSADELKDLIVLRLRMNALPEDTYDLNSFDHDQLVQILESRAFGRSYEAIDQAAHEKTYLTFIGTDPVIYAQYTDEKKHSNHAVAVVGWDDTFAADNWPEDRRPPADGAWIVKNSWGTEWGNEGYFMLSYYDMSLCAIGTFDYVVEEDNLKLDHVEIKGYDNMPVEMVSSTLFDTPVYAANVYTMDNDSVLEYVSVMTGDLDAAVTASVYLLDEDAAGPEDGVLLEKTTETFRYAGYHRMSLAENLLLPKGSRIGIVVLENVPVKDGNKYALVNTSSMNQKGVEEYNAQTTDMPTARYARGIVNSGESFVSFEAGKWTDWSDAIHTFENRGDNAKMAYDNLPISAYLYLWSEVEQAHDLSKRIPSIGGEAAICPEDGFTVLDAAGAGTAGQ